MDKGFIVEGFAFDNSKDYSEARREAEAVTFLRAKLDMADSNEVIKAYGKLMQKKQAFSTPVGISFLKELRDKVLATGMISDENLKLIEINSKVAEKSNSAAENFKDSVEKGLRNQIMYLRDKIKQLKIIITFMFFIIAALFALTILGKNTFVNAELKAQDKYAEWEQELSEWEQELEEREKVLQEDGK